MCALGLSAAAVAMAAPMQGELAASAAADGAAARDGVAGVGAVHTRPSTSTQTVDLLIDLQPRNAGLSFNERAPTAERAMRAGVPLAERGGATEPRTDEDAAGKKAATADAVPSALFGTGATPPVTSQQHMPSAGSHTPVGATRASNGAPGDGPTSAPAQQTDLPAWLQWPRELIGFVRENRDLVIGGIVAILAVSGGMSMLFGRNRRS